MSSPHDNSANRAVQSWSDWRTYTDYRDMMAGKGQTHFGPGRTSWPVFMGVMGCLLALVTGQSWMGVLYYTLVWAALGLAIKLVKKYGASYFDNLTLAHSKIGTGKTWRTRGLWAGVALGVLSALAFHLALGNTAVVGAIAGYVGGYVLWLIAASVVRYGLKPQ